MASRNVQTFSRDRHVQNCTEEKARLLGISEALKTTLKEAPLRLRR